MMKKLLVLLLGISTACETPTQNALPSFIQSKIKEVEKEPVWNPPTKIYRYKYQNEIAYYITSDCCDRFNNVYDANGKILCSPVGGCASFFQIAQNPELIWEDRRLR